VQLKFGIKMKKPKVALCQSRRQGICRRIPPVMGPAQDPAALLTRKKFETAFDFNILLKYLSYSTIFKN
jgi:hypothetical protein